MSKQIRKIEGLPVVNARTPLTIEVQKCDLPKGKMKDPGLCVVAQAAMRQFNAKAVLVHLSRLYVNDGKKWVRWATPRNARTELVAFDRGGGFRTGEYYFDPPAEHQRSGHPSAGGTPDYDDYEHPGSGRKKKRPYKIYAPDVRHHAPRGRTKN